MNKSKLVIIAFILLLVAVFGKLIDEKRREIELEKNRPFDVMRVVDCCYVHIKNDNREYQIDSPILMFLKREVLEQREIKVPVEEPDWDYVISINSVDKPSVVIYCSNSQNIIRIDNRYYGDVKTYCDAIEDWWAMEYCRCYGVEESAE
mgnify:CR=1 FL=1